MCKAKDSDLGNKKFSSRDLVVDRATGREAWVVERIKIYRLHTFFLPPSNSLKSRLQSGCGRCRAWRRA